MICQQVHHRALQVVDTRSITHHVTSAKQQKYSKATGSGKAGGASVVINDGTDSDVIKGASDPPASAAAKTVSTTDILPPLPTADLSKTSGINEQHVILCSLHYV
jgi:hypothetical protein